MSWITIPQSAIDLVVKTSWNAVSGTGLLGSSPGSSAAPPSSNEDLQKKLFRIRNGLISKIFMAMLAYMTKGTKVSYIANGIRLDEPGVTTSISRTYSYWFDDTSGCSKLSLQPLITDFNSADHMYQMTHSTQNAKFSQYALLGLDGFAETYARELTDDHSILSSFFRQAEQTLKKTAPTTIPEEPPSPSCSSSSASVAAAPASQPTQPQELTPIDVIINKTAPTTIPEEPSSPSCSSSSASVAAAPTSQPIQPQELKPIDVIIKGSIKIHQMNQIIDLFDGIISEVPDAAAVRSGKVPLPEGALRKLKEIVDIANKCISDLQFALNEYLKKDVLSSARTATHMTSL